MRVFWSTKPASFLLSWLGIRIEGPTRSWLMPNASRCLTDTVLSLLFQQLYSFVVIGDFVL